MATINQVNNGDTALLARTTWNDNDTAVNVEVTAATAAITALQGRFDKQTTNLVADTDNTDITNPFVFPIVPNVVQVRASDGTLILDAYQNVNPANGNITIQTGANYTGAIITIIGW